MPVLEPTDIHSPSDRGRSFTSVSGVLSSRCVAFLVDFVVIGVLTGFFGFLLVLLGLFTFFLPWLLLPPLMWIVALFYNGITMSGRNRGTWGMRMTGIGVRLTDGSRVPFINAAVHAILFDVSVSALRPPVLLFGLFRDDRRLLHDCLTGITVARRWS
jgi:uncharacterized RDD family membrane protein YckC